MKAKSQQVDSPPNHLEELRNSLDLEVFQNLITKNIIVARCFQTQEPYPPPTYSLGLLQNISTVVSSHVVMLGSVGRKKARSRHMR